MADTPYFPQISSTYANAIGVVKMLTANVLPFMTLKVSAADLSGKYVIVSGSNVGIGLEVARKLAANGAHMILACRDAAKAEKAKEDIIKSTGNENVEVRVVDFSNLDSVRAFIKNYDLPLDILVNNAGITADTFQKTTEGFELTFVTNYLSHYLFTLSLLPKMRAGARIINVSSHGNFTVGLKQMDLSGNIDTSKYLGSQNLKLGDRVGLEVYGRSKLLQIMFTREFQARLSKSPVYSGKNIKVYSCHPGLVTSTIWGRNKQDKAAIPGFVKSLGINCEQGACTPVFLATAPESGLLPGAYYDRMICRTPNALAYDPKLNTILWEKSAKLAGISLPIK